MVISYRNDRVDFIFFGTVCHKFLTESLTACQQLNLLQVCVLNITPSMEGLKMSPVNCLWLGL